MSSGMRPRRGASSLRHQNAVVSSRPLEETGRRFDLQLASMPSSTLHDPQQDLDRQVRVAEFVGRFASAVRRLIWDALEDARSVKARGWQEANVYHIVKLNRVEKYVYLFVDRCSWQEEVNRAKRERA